MDAKTIKNVILEFISKQGAVTVDEIKAACTEAGAKPKEIDGRIDGTLRLLSMEGWITDNSGPNGGRYYIAAKKLKSKKAQEARSLERPKRGDPYEFTTTIRLRVMSLAGAIPVGDEAEQGSLVFHRDLQGRIMLLPKTWQGLFRKVFEALEQETKLPKYVADWLDFDPVTLDVIPIVVKEPVPPAKPGGQGQGVNTIEALPIGTEITVTGIFPGTAVTRKALRPLWDYAGRVGYSNAKSKLGYGKFDVLDCRVTADLSALFNMDESADQAVEAVM